MENSEERSKKIVLVVFTVIVFAAAVLAVFLPKDSGGYRDVYMILYDESVNYRYDTRNTDSSINSYVIYQYDGNSHLPQFEVYDLETEELITEGKRDMGVTYFGVDSFGDKYTVLLGEPPYKKGEYTVRFYFEGYENFSRKTYQIGLYIV